MRVMNHRKRLAGKLAWPVYVFAICILIAIGPIASAAAPPRPEAVKITTIATQDYPEIKCYVSATDRNGDFFSGLGPAAFDLREDGQRITDLSVNVLASSEERISAFLVMDCSGSMDGSPIREARRAAADFIGRSPGKDPIGVVVFATDLKESPLTTDHQRALAFVKGERPVNKMNTAMYDAVKEAIIKLAGESSVKAIVALTDGLDNRSRATIEDCLTLAKRHGVTIYPVGLGKVNSEALQRLADETGGYCYLTNDPNDLAGIYERIARRLHSVYLLTYHSAQAIRRISTVRITLANGDAVDQRQYDSRTIASSGGASGQTAALLIAAGLLLVNLALLGLLLSRRSRARSGKVASGKPLEPFSGR